MSEKKQAERNVKMKRNTAAAAAQAPDVPRAAGGILVLQWLNYAFWLWLGVSMSWLAGVVVDYYVDQSSSIIWSGELVYPLAAVIVMMIITLVTDWFYAKHEPAQKVGGANVIMLLHAVPFVLIAIGGLIAMVFSLLTMLLNSNPVDTIDGPIRVLLVAFVAAVIFGLLAYRLVFGGRRAIVRLAAWIILGVMAVGFVAATLAGPAAEAARTKQDRLIETALPELAWSIQAYTEKNDKLPDSMTDIANRADRSTDAVQAMIDQRLVTYKPNTVPVKAGNALLPGGDAANEEDVSVMPISMGKGNQKRFYYQLCTTYQYEKKIDASYSSGLGASYTTESSAGEAADYRSSYVQIANHPAGQVCYNLYADGKYIYNEKVSD